MSFKRRVLSALGKDVLLEIGRGLELDVTTRMGVEELRDALAKSKRAKLDAIVQESLSRDTLKDICGAVGLDDTGKEKAALVERILAAGGDKAANGAGYRIDPVAVRGSKAAEGGGALGALLSGLDAVPAKKPTKAKGKTKKGERRRGGFPESEAVIAGTLKAALQQFALGAAGGYSGAGAHVAFTTHLLECFGWPAGRPDGAAIPHTFAIADAGKRVEREVALWWPERRTLMEVAGHDAGLDFAWKDLVRVCLQLDPIPRYVVLTNQRDLQLYDLARDREARRLAIRIDDLPKYSEAFPFFTKEWTPGAVPKIVNVEKVSEDVADLVARLYRSVRAQHAGREKDVIRFTLQCITAMFAEDIGLLPRNYFTSLLYDGAKRYASGAHYTAHDDIMRVVGPTIVEPWRKRIVAATSLKELTELRRELFAFRVLDPACGSGNFLYVAFRELYRLDTELLSRMREFPSTAGKLSWNGGISAANFYGIDINPFAVELAKVTLNIAKKIAFEERKAQAFALAGQVEMDIDPSLPLDNLDKNIVCADALFTEWPEVDAIVSNPPFLGTQKVRKELGVECLQRLQDTTGVDGIVELACYWFRRAHDRLLAGGRAGLVGTSGIRVGKARECSLDYILGGGGTIVNAVSSRAWPGEAAVNVSMVNWVKGSEEGPFQVIVDDISYPVAQIASHLQLHTDVSTAKLILANKSGATLGMIFGHEAFRSGLPGFPTDAGPAIRPVAMGNDLLRGRLSTEPDYCINLTECNDEADATRVGGKAFEHLRKHVYPWVNDQAESKDAPGVYPAWLRRWWTPWAPRADFFAPIAGRRRILVCPKVSARPCFAFISMQFVPTDTMYVFAFDDDYTFAIVQSDFHWGWTKAKGSRVRQDFQYTTDVWRSFPWPQDPTEEQVAAVGEGGRALRRMRETLMEDNAWSLRQLLQVAEVDGPHPLKDAQAALDAAGADAYGMPPDQGPTEFLLELNQLVAEDEQQGRKVRGPGLPDHLDPKDPRWFSTDCIEPPPVGS